MVTLTEMNVDAESEIVTIASQLSSTSFQEIPRTLLKLEGMILNSYQDSVQLTNVCDTILSYKLLPLLIGMLKQDFGKLDGKWKTASRMTDLLSLIAKSLKTSNVKPKQYETFLSSCIDSLLLLSHNIQRAYVSCGDERKEILSSFTTVLNNLQIIVHHFHHLFTFVINSTWLQEMFLFASDDAEVTLKELTSFLIKIAKYNFDDASINKKAIHAILDELVYRVSTSVASYSASYCLKCIFHLAEVSHLILSILRSRYKGISTLVKKFEKDPVLKNDVKCLLIMLKEGSIQSANQQRLSDAAIKIQSYYRGYRCRKRLNRLHVTFSNFQKKYRDHLAKKENRRVEAIQNIQTVYRASINRRQTFRKSRQKQLDVISMIPADRVETYLQEQQTIAALKIQSSWRGYKVRKNIGEEKKSALQNRAAKTIQSKFRDWSEKRNSGKIETRRNDEISDEEKISYQEIIEKWQNDNRVKFKNREQLELQLEEIRSALQMYYSSISCTRRSLQHCEGLAAQMECDAQLLDDNTLNVDGADVRLYKSFSKSIATEAKKLHDDRLAKLNRPRWQKLIDSDSDEG